VFVLPFVSTQKVSRSSSGHSGYSNSRRIGVLCPQLDQPWLLVVGAPFAISLLAHHEKGHHTLPLTKHYARLIWKVMTLPVIQGVLLPLKTCFLTIFGELPVSFEVP